MVRLRKFMSLLQKTVQNHSSVIDIKTIGRSRDRKGIDEAIKISHGHNNCPKES